MKTKKYMQIVKYATIFLFLICCFSLFAQETGIKPYAENNRFWEYQGKPVLLLGASSNDNLFQNPDVVDELNVMRSIGANYVRCTLSGRDVGDEWPFWRNARFFNLNKFNPDFWKNLDDFLKFTKERNIFVQIEIWAFHDFMGGWERNPWNPALNNVFTEENTKLQSKNYGENRIAKHDFFFSVPVLNNDTLLLSYQKTFVDQLVSVSFKYDHVLYCITNEIFTQYSPEWGWFWAAYLKEKASEAGVEIQVTEMFQNTDVLHEQHHASINHPEVYSYIDLSQNSTTDNQKHWEQLEKVRQSTAGSPRPINHVKIYGGARGEWTDGPNHGIERFWRNLIGGSAGMRFHRPPAGIGISNRAQAQIKSAALLAGEYDFFTSEPDVNFGLMDEREEDETYLATNQHEEVVVYFSDGGQIMVDFTGFSGIYKLQWLNLEGSNWYRETEIEGEQIIELNAPHAGGWIALLKKLPEN